MSVCTDCQKNKNKEAYVPFQGGMSASTYKKFPSIINGDTQSPAGGWRFQDFSTGREILISGVSAQDVLNQVVKLRQNNNTFTTLSELQYEIDYSWYLKNKERYPKGWGDKVATPAALETKLETKVLSLERAGNIIWEYFNLYAYAFDLEQFKKTVERSRLLLNPDESKVGCKDCYRHWELILKEHPIDNIETQEDALSWIYLVHNKVNLESGKRWISKDEFLTKYGVAIP